MKTTFLITFLFIILSNYTFSQFGGGNGTSADPYQIYIKEHLKELDDSVKKSPINDSTTYYNWSRNKYFKLMNDIVDSVKIIIGSTKYSYEYAYFFQGDFNGNNKKIILAINGYEFVGLFSAIYQANIYDLIAEGYVNGSNYIGSICGLAQENSHIKNCFNYGNVNGSEYVGGICGSASDISNCINYSNIKGNIYVGGIVGIANNMLYCKNLGNISGYEAIGGITGCLRSGNYNYTSKLLYCENSGNVSGVFSVGGISGHTHDSTEYSYCINIGTIKGDSLVGGIAGGFDNNNALRNGNIYNSVNSGLVIGKDIVGGIMGRCFGEIKNCLNTGAVKGNTKWGCIVGEVVGKDNQKGTITNCHYDKQVCGGGE